MEHNRLKKIGWILLAFVMCFGIFLRSPSKVLAAGAKETDDYQVILSWNPTSLSQVPDSLVANEWQVSSGIFFDGENGATTQNCSGKEVIVRKNVIASGIENLFYVALKVRAQASWAEEKHYRW